MHLAPPLFSPLGSLITLCHCAHARRTALGCMAFLPPPAMYSTRCLCARIFIKHTHAFRACIFLGFLYPRHTAITNFSPMGSPLLFTTASGACASPSCSLPTTAVPYRHNALYPRCHCRFGSLYSLSAAALPALPHFVFYTAVPLPPHGWIHLPLSHLLIWALPSNCAPHFLCLLYLWILPAILC